VPSGDVVVEGRAVVVAGRVVVGVSFVIEGVRVLSSGVRTSESTFPPSGMEMAEVPSSPGMMSLIEGIPVSVAASDVTVTKARSASAIESAVSTLPLTVMNLLVLSFICEILPYIYGFCFPPYFITKREFYVPRGILSKK
jgi:hypothetical protein